MKESTQFKDTIKNKFEGILYKHEDDAKRLGVHIDYVIYNNRSRLLRSKNTKTYSLCLAIRFYPVEYNYIAAKKAFVLKEFVLTIAKVKKQGSGYILSKKDPSYFEAFLVRQLRRIEALGARKYCRETAVDLIKCIFSCKYANYKKSFHNVDLKIIFLILGVLISLVFILAALKIRFNFYQEYGYHLPHIPK